MRPNLINVNRFGPLATYTGVALLFFALSIGSVLWQSRSATEKTNANMSALNTQIEKIQKEIAAHPNDVKQYIALSGAYLQKVRETGDASYYATIDDLLSKAAAQDASNTDISAMRASVANGRHHFNDGLALANDAISRNPTIATYYGIKADALIELGKYDEAESTLQIMVDKKPNYSAFTRIAYLRELTGDIVGSKEALQIAIDSGSTFPENIAWAYVELGLLQVRSDLGAAQNSFDEALRIDPKYPLALEGLGKVAFARNDSKVAESKFTEAFSQRPLAQYAIDLGDLYTTQGKTTEAAQQYALARVAFEKSVSSGTDVDLEYSIFLSDHGAPTEALTKAALAYRDRPSIYGADAYAWALYKNNRPAEAGTYSKEALRLGENDPLIVYHAAMIALASGDSSSAKQFFKKTAQLNPHFSILFASSLQEHLK